VHHVLSGLLHACRPTHKAGKTGAEKRPWFKKGKNPVELISKRLHPERAGAPKST